MKRNAHIVTLAALALLAAPSVSAGVFGEGNADVQDTVLNDLEKPAYMGTGLSADSPSIDIYHGAFAGDLDGRIAVGAAGPEKSFGPWGEGNSDAYGTVIPR
jgi:hypothetical protein